MKTVGVALAFVLLAAEARAEQTKAPTTLAKAGAQAQANASAKSAAATGGDMTADARAHMKEIYEGVWRIGRLQAGANGSAVRAGCVADKLAQAKIHVRLASDEIALVEKAARPRQDASDGDGDAANEADVRYALTRLELLARRTDEVERAARVCIEDDRSAIDVTRVDVQIGPAAGEADGQSGGAAPFTGPR